MTQVATGQPLASIKDSILSVLTRIGQSALGRRKTELPTAEFSNALNSVGERFIDLLLQNERTGRWWLGENGEWLVCTVRSTGRRVTRNFYPGDTPEWQSLGATSRHIADPMTGPDHIVTASIPSLSLNCKVVLEQKFRFATRQDAFAGSTAYVKHLLLNTGCKLPTNATSFDVESFCAELLNASTYILTRIVAGKVLYSGNVPQICYVSINIPPKQIFVIDKASQARTACDFVGFLAPLVDQFSVMNDSPAAKIVRKAKVRLWIGLDSLLEQCATSEVDDAWNTAIQELGAAIRNPSWRVE